MLATMGVRTIGDCLRLPRDGFARRFEPRMLDMLDRAVSRRPDPRGDFLPRERFAARRDLEPEVAEVTRLDAVVAPLLADLCAFLRQRQRSVQGLELRLVHREAPPTRLRLRFAEPVAEPARIARLLGERLARVVLPEPVRALRVRSGPLVESREQPGDLFAVARRHSGAGVPQLIERLQARLGADAVYGLCLIPEHRPESAWRVAEPGEKGPCLISAGTKMRHGPFPPRPLWLLAEPQQLDGVEQPRFEGVLELEEGPERIESGWWDGHDVARDYHVARNPACVRFWVFRERRPPGRWFLHGVFG
jgi:protein ImuB